MEPADLRVGAVLAEHRASAVMAAIGEAASTIATMPANFTRFPNSDRRVFDVTRARDRDRGLDVTLPRLRAWGTMRVPGNLWRALSRFGPWIEPMLVAEWSRLIRGYAERMGIPVPPGVAEAALEWREPVRSTALARHAAERAFMAGHPVECVWTGLRLRPAALDVDHCLPWAAWPCGDLWNLAPCDSRVNRHQKRDRLPSAATLAGSRQRIIRWWETAYMSDEALGLRFTREAAASLPLGGEGGLPEVYSALDWRRLRLLRDQQVPEWSAGVTGPPSA